MLSAPSANRPPRLTSAVLTLLCAASLTGCIAAPDDEESVGVAEQPALTSNALTSNALTSNALTSNALTSNALTSNALTSNALTSNGLTDPGALLFLRYLVGCALPQGQHMKLAINGQPYLFKGDVGVAPEWGQPGGTCGATCQRWVSACVLARVDYLGVAEEISIRGQNAALTPSNAEAAHYTSREATYYGNVFESPQERYACLSPGETEIPRVCGPSLAGCVVNVGGSCSDLCGEPQPDGSFPNCATTPDKKAPRFHESITVFLAP